MQKLIYERVNVFLQERSPEQLLQMAFLFFIGMWVFILYAEKLSHTMPGVMCFAIYLFCVGGMVVTFLYGCLAEKAGLPMAVGIALLMMSVFIRMEGAFRTLPMKADLSLTGTLLTVGSLYFCSGILRWCWAYIWRLEEKNWRRTHTKEDWRGRICWVCLNVFLFDLLPIILLSFGIFYATFQGVWNFFCFFYPTWFLLGNKI